MIKASIYVYGITEAGDKLVDAFTRMSWRDFTFLKPTKGQLGQSMFNRVMDITYPTEDYLSIVVDALNTERTFIQQKRDNDYISSAEYDHGVCVYHMAGSIIDMISLILTRSAEAKMKLKSSQTMINIIIGSSLRRNTASMALLT